MQSLVDTYKQNVSLGKIQREKEQERLVIKFDTLRIAVEQNRKKKFVFQVSTYTKRYIPMGRRRLWEIHDNGQVRRVSYRWS